VLSPHDPRLVETLIGLGSVCSALARYREEEAYYQRAISIREKALGGRHVDTFRIVNKLAELSRKTVREGRTSLGQSDRHLGGCAWA
jgi:hypothetical protein